MTPASLEFTIYKGTTSLGVVVTCKDSDGAVVDLTDWTPYAEARKEASSPTAVALNPTISDGPGGKVTLGSMTDEQTSVLNPGDYGWNLLLENPAGQILGPFIEGKLSVKPLFTQPA